MSESISKKVEHVRKAKQTRSHECHWPDCTEQVPPAMWGCRKHWFMLPKGLRAKIWATYYIKQEDGVQRPSRDYVNIAKQAQEWIAENYPSKTG